MSHLKVIFAVGDTEYILIMSLSMYARYKAMFGLFQCLPVFHFQCHILRLLWTEPIMFSLFLAPIMGERWGGNGMQHAKFQECFNSIASHIKKSVDDKISIIKGLPIIPDAKPPKQTKKYFDKNNSFYNNVMNFIERDQDIDDEGRGDDNIAGPGNERHAEEDPVVANTVPSTFQ